MATFRQPLVINNTTPIPLANTTGQTMTFVHPGNLRLHNTSFKVKVNGAPATRAQIEAIITRVQYRFGSAIFRDFTPFQRGIMQDIRGLKQVAGVFTEHYSDPMAAAPLGHELTAWDLITTRIPQFDIVLTIDRVNAAGSGPTNAVEIECISSFDQVANINTQNGAFAGRFEALKSFGSQLVAGTEQSNFLLPRTNPFARLWIFLAAGETGNLPTRVQIRRNKVKIYDFKQTAADPELANELAKFGLAPKLKGDGTVDQVWPVILNPNGFVSDFLEITPLDTLELITDIPGTTSPRVEFMVEQFFGGPAAV